MTDKEQILIDGVNVKDCRRRIGKDNYCRYFKRLCSDNNFNCVWKQLARKTQEYEQLEEKYEALKLENEEGYEIVDELKQECEELKKQLNTSEKWRINAESLNEKQDLENTRYCKALEEIEEVIKSPCAEDCVYYEPSRCYDCIKTSILDIIRRAKTKGE